MDPTDSAVMENSPKSQLGQREAYDKLIHHQYSQFHTCAVTFYSLLTSFSIHKASEIEKKKLKEPPHIQLDNNGNLPHPHVYSYHYHFMLFTFH
jgi:hypothetical protein